MGEKIKLYHVSYNFTTDDFVKNFKPRVPKWTTEERSTPVLHMENSTIPRICFSDSINHAMSAAVYWPSEGEEFMVYELTVDKDDPNLILPETLYAQDYVRDALETREHWYLEPVTLTGTPYVITHMEDYNEWAWSCLEVSQVKQALRNTLVNRDFCDADMRNDLTDYLNWSQYNTALEIYNDIESYLAISCCDTDEVAKRKELVWTYFRNSLRDMDWATVHNYSNVFYEKVNDVSKQIA